MTYSLHFSYDKRGHGQLELCADDDIEMQYECRTGSINANGRLVNACPPALYYCSEKSVSTDIPSMTVVAGKGRWLRLWKDEEPTHLGVHGDGSIDGKHAGNGTDGCIGTIGTDANPLHDRVNEILKTQPRINVYISKQEAV